MWTTIAWLILAAVFSALAGHLFLSDRFFEIRLQIRFARIPREDPSRVTMALAATSVLVVSAIVFAVHSLQPLRDRLLWSGATAVVLPAVGWGLIRVVRQRSLERAAFSERWQDRTDQVWRTLRAELDLKSIPMQACRQMAAALDTREVSLYLASGVDYMCVYSTLPNPRRERYTADDAILRAIARSAAAHSLEWKDPQIRLVVPMFARTRLTGFFLFGPLDDDRDYSSAERRFAEDVAIETERALAVASLVENQLGARASSILSERERAQSERAWSYVVQPEHPQIPGLNYGSSCWHGQAGAAALCDILNLSKGSMGLVVAVTSSNGIAGAIEMAQLQVLLRSRFWAYSEDLAELLESVERAWLAWRTTRTPLRLLVARYVPQTSTLHYASAGAEQPIWVRRGAEGAEVRRSPGAGLPLCTGEEREIERGEIVMEPGDLIILSSSGLLNARSGRGETWGLNRLLETAITWEGQPAADMSHLVLRAAEEFSDRVREADDRAVVILKRERAA